MYRRHYIFTIVTLYLSHMTLAQIDEDSASSTDNQVALDYYGEYENYGSEDALPPVDGTEGTADGEELYDDIYAQDDYKVGTGEIIKTPVVEVETAQNRGASIETNGDSPVSIEISPPMQNQEMKVDQPNVDFVPANSPNVRGLSNSPVGETRSGSFQQMPNYQANPVARDLLPNPGKNILNVELVNGGQKVQSSKKNIDDSMRVDKSNINFVDATDGAQQYVNKDELVKSLKDNSQLFKKEIMVNGKKLSNLKEQKKVYERLKTDKSKDINRVSQLSRDQLNKVMNEFSLGGDIFFNPLDDVSDSDTSNDGFDPFSTDINAWGSQGFGISPGFGIQNPFQINPIQQPMPPMNIASVTTGFNLGNTDKNANRGQGLPNLAINPIVNEVAQQMAPVIPLAPVAPKAPVAQPASQYVYVDQPQGAPASAGKPQYEYVYEYVYEDGTPAVAGMKRSGQVGKGPVKRVKTRKGRKLG